MAVGKFLTEFKLIISVFSFLFISGHSLHDFQRTQHSTSLVS